MMTMNSLLGFQWLQDIQWRSKTIKIKTETLTLNLMTKIRTTIKNSLDQTMLRIKMTKSLINLMIPLIVQFLKLQEHQSLGSLLQIKVIIYKLLVIPLIIPKILISDNSLDLRVMKTKDSQLHWMTPSLVSLVWVILLKII